MKKYVITGSIGHISKPVVEGLVKAGKEVNVITSDAARVSAIEALGAKALVGSVSDRDFVKRAFRDADVVYTMIPPIWQTSDWRAAQNEVARIYTEALQGSTVKYVVNLSSIGAHLGNGVGPVDGLADFEKMLNGLPGIQVKHLRPGYFFYNFITQIGLINHAGILGDNFGLEGQKIPLVHTRDIAAVALEELLNVSFAGKSFRYILSDHRTMQDAARVLGQAIGKNIPWVVFTDEQALKGALDAGVPASHAGPFIEMGAMLRSGRMQEDLEKHAPTPGSTKLEDFASEFQAAFTAAS
ncbi:NmrA family NAD(P)-binding protein [Parachryseolinea silvisoli]|uniref:NmrA family NAD(P)-binding protein n=1 Tax=Parachryseolinea silvisoli TaxID=2873601 RepID=UPI002265A387|nr:NAD(P)H-binding protein [Parachryseolinea silvisoli]MCD9018593.1 NAD(P)H-binding protein [Parachryseolinea silvisoli]